MKMSFLACNPHRTCVPQLCLAAHPTFHRCTLIACMRALSSQAFPTGRYLISDNLLRLQIC